MHRQFSESDGGFILVEVVHRSVGGVGGWVEWVGDTKVFSDFQRYKFDS